MSGDQIARELGDHGARLKALEDAKYGDRLTKIERFQNTVSVLWAAAGAIAVFFGQFIRDKLHHL